MKSVAEIRSKNDNLKKKANIKDPDIINPRGWRRLIIRGAVTSQMAATATIHDRLQIVTIFLDDIS